MINELSFFCEIFDQQYGEMSLTLHTNYVVNHNYSMSPTACITGVFCPSSNLKLKKKTFLYSEIITLQIYRYN